MGFWLVEGDLMPMDKTDFFLGKTDDEKLMIHLRFRMIDICKKKPDNECEDCSELTMWCESAITHGVKRYIKEIIEKGK